MTTRSSWIIRHDHNDVFVRYRELDGSRAYYTREPEEAEQFASQAAALAVITTQFNGRGRAMEFVAPAIA